MAGWRERAAVHFKIRHLAAIRLGGFPIEQNRQVIFPSH
jgi:hypothetical protein